MEESETDYASTPEQRDYGRRLLTWICDGLPDTMLLIRARHLDAPFAEVEAGEGVDNLLGDFENYLATEA